MTPILLSIIASIAIFWSGFAVGKAWSRWTYKLSVYVDLVKTKLQPKQPEVPKPTATIIDPQDVRQRAQWERDQMMNAINEPEIRE